MTTFAVQMKKTDRLNVLRRLKVLGRVMRCLGIVYLPCTSLMLDYHRVQPRQLMVVPRCWRGVIKLHHTRIHASYLRGYWSLEDLSEP